MADNLVLEEYKHVAEDRRFYVSRYLQAAAFYFAIAGLGINTLLNVSNKAVLVVLTILSEAINVIVFFVAKKFQNIVYHSLNRETEISKMIGFQTPYPLVWGYYLALMIVAVVAIGFALLLFIRLPTLH